MMDASYSTPHHAGPQTPLLTPEQAGEYLRTHPRTLANWRVSGDGPAFCRIGRRPFYRLADLDAFINARHFNHRGAERSKRGVA